MFLFTFHHQGAIPQRGWAVREMGPRTFRNTSRTDLLQTDTLGPVLRNMVFICGNDALFLFRWFEGFNWDGLYKRTLNPPVIPRVSHIKILLIVFCSDLFLLCVRYLFLYVFQVKHLSDSGSCDHYAESSVELSTNWDDF